MEEAAMTPIELAWAAGLFEGEGTVRINKPSPRNWGALVVSVVNTDRQVLDWFQSRWPGYMKPATGLGPNQRPAWVWTIAARQAAGFLRDILPYVVRDAVRAKIAHALEFQGQKRNDTRSMSGADRYAYAEEQWCSYWWMGELNQRGNPNADFHRRPR
jgi:hypothetical protein